MGLIIIVSALTTTLSMQLLYPDLHAPTQRNCLLAMTGMHDLPAAAACYVGGRKLYVGGRCYVCDCTWYAGVQNRLLQVHKWPRGFDMDTGWFTEAVNLMASILGKHARNACGQGISPEEHMRPLISAPG